MRTRLLLVSLAASLGCASAPNATRTSASVWPDGSEPQFRSMSRVGFGQPGAVRFISTSPKYVLFLELRQSLDTMDVRTSINVSSDVAVTASTDLSTSMETVDALERATASAQFGNCTIMRSAGDPTGHEVCPVSRSYGPESGRKWRFRNRVFLLVSDQPFATPLPRAIQWASRHTTPPVMPGAKWTAFGL